MDIIVYIIHLKNNFIKKKQQCCMAWNSRQLCHFVARGFQKDMSFMLRFFFYDE